MLYEDKYLIYDYEREDTLPFFLKQCFYRASCIGYDLRRMASNPIRHMDDKPYKVSICAIFKDEGKYLKEWIEYHKIVGIDHFFMYNNNSTDNFAEVLRPYILSGDVTLAEWPKKHSQNECYVDCMKKYGKQSAWIGFIDIDEYVVPRKYDDIFRFLKSLPKNAGSVLINWRHFGSSGRIAGKGDEKVVPEIFISCWGKLRSTGKCFWNTSFRPAPAGRKGVNATLHHFLWIIDGHKLIPPVNVFGKCCLPKYGRLKSDDVPIQINHYFSKSYEEYVAKCKKDDVFFEKNPHNMEYFYIHEKNCIGADYSIFKYVTKLKLKMGI